MLRFVILEHDHPELHWDFMLEDGQILRTWRLSRPPAEGEVASAQPLPNHRTFYLEYEGPVSGSRGTVRRWDAGDYEMLPAGKGELLRVRLVGQKTRGIGVLRTDYAACTFSVRAFSGDAQGKPDS